MKTIFFMLFCTFFVFTNSSYATDIGFNVQIWKNGTNMGYFSGSTDSDNPYAVETNNLGQVCPGDVLTIKNYIAKDGSAHDFTGLSTFGKATIALSNSTGYFVPLTIFGQVCSLSCTPVPTVPNWNWGSTVTFTVPAYGSTSPYLTIMTGAGNTTPNPSCGPRWIHIPMNLAPTTAIADQTICPDEMVNLPLDPNFTYSSWSNPNPDGTILDATTSYTVDITHTATGCTQTANFTINILQPDTDPFADEESLCFNEAGFTLTESWFWNLAGSNNAPVKLVIDGVVIAEQVAGPDIMNFPHTINGANYPLVFGSRIITVEYTYQDFTTGIICTKTYTITIHPQPSTDLEDSYAVCDGNFTSICANSGGWGTFGTSYQWTKTGDFFVHSTSHCFTPSSYGEYCLTMINQFGCKTKKCFTVYDPGVGITGPSDIIYCSLYESPIGTVGWHIDPFDGDPATYVWTYTNDEGTTVSIANTAPYYQVPNMGTGIYTVVVTAGGCTETFTVYVTDLLHVYENHSNAAFGFTPLSSSVVACIPTTPMGGMTEEWIVEDEFGTTIPTTSYLSGIQFNYATGIEYTVIFKRTSGPQWCQVFTNKFTWLDNSTRGTGGNGNNSGSNNRISTTNTGITASVPLSMQAFPNPTTGLINLKLSNLTNTTSNIEVINSLGVVVLQKEVQDISTIELDLSKQSSGIYMIRVINGNTEITKKVIKE